jgi:hypothetical protein
MPRRITRGDAEAVLNAFGTGGMVILRQQGETAEAAPADFLGVMARSARFKAHHGTDGISVRRTGTSSLSDGSTAGMRRSTTKKPGPPSTP